MRVRPALWRTAALAVLTGCATRTTPPPVIPLLQPEQVAVRVYLIGDAGATYLVPLAVAGALAFCLGWIWLGATSMGILSGGRDAATI